MTSNQQVAADCVVVNMELLVVLAANPAASDDYHVVGVKAHPTGSGGLHRQDHRHDDYHVVGVPAGGRGLQHLEDHRHHVVDVDRDLVVSVAPAKPTSPKSGHVDIKTEGQVEIKTEGHVEIKDADGGGGASGRNPCCLVCTEPMRWVAVGRCGHGAVCSKCMVEVRFYQQNKRCGICKTHCPKVLVTKAEAVSDGVATLLKLPRFRFRDGRVGKFWYHGHTAAYFEDEEQYQYAKTECHGIVRPFYKPVFLFVLFFGFLVFCGALIGSAFASEAKHHSSRVRAYPISIFIALSVGAFLWSMPCWLTEPDDLQHKRSLRSASQ